MRRTCQLGFGLALSIAILAISGANARAQASYAPPNDLPNLYRIVTNWAQLPDGRKWGSTSGVAIGPDGNIWTYDRCGGNSCADSKLAPIVEFEPSGKLLQNFGAAMFILPHGIFVDKDGNVWVTDGVGGMATSDDAGKHGKGHQIFKFSPDGKVLMTLGKEIRIGSRRVQRASHPGFRFQRETFCGRPVQQSHPDFRPGWQIHRRMEAVWPTERNFY